MTAPGTVPVSAQQYRAGMHCALLSFTVNEVDAVAADAERRRAWPSIVKKLNRRNAEKQQLQAS